MNDSILKNPESYFNLWRTLVAITHVDNVVTLEERDKIREFLAHARLDEDQVKVLEEDLNSKSSPEEFIEKITVPSHLAQLHHLANVIFQSDQLDYREDVFLKKIEENIKKRINFLGALKMVEEEKRVLEEREQKREVKGFFNNLVEFYRR